MNKAIIESIEWHKDCLFKLLEDDDLIKMEGDINSVKTELDEIIEKAKKRVWVKPTAQKKGHYREQEAGRKAEAGESIERLKNTASALMTTEVKLKKAGKIDEAKKLRKEKINPTLKRLYALEEKSGS